MKKNNKNPKKIRLSLFEMIIIFIISCLLTSLYLIILPDSYDHDEYMDVTPHQVYNPGAWIQ